jgi:hypothetical protein
MAKDSNDRNDHVKIEHLPDGRTKTTSKFSYGDRGHYKGKRKNNKKKDN